jgi:hypothetical protein
MADLERVYEYLCEKSPRARMVPPEWYGMLQRLCLQGRARVVGGRTVTCGPRNSLRRYQRMAVALVSDSNPK